MEVVPRDDSRLPADAYVSMTPGGRVFCVLILI